MWYTFGISNPLTPVLTRTSNIQVFARHRPQMMWNFKKPFQPHDCFIAPTATVIGDVVCWDQASIWYGAVVRAEHHNITIGFCSTIGEGCVLQTVKGPLLETGFPPYVSVGHYNIIGAGSILTSCEIADLVLVGDKCTIGEGAMVETKVYLEPGTVVPPYARIPSGQRWGGNPAKFISHLDHDEEEAFEGLCEERQALAWEQLTEFLPVGATYLHWEELERKFHGAPLVAK